MEELIQPQDISGNKKNNEKFNSYTFNEDKPGDYWRDYNYGKTEEQLKIGREVKPQSLKYCTATTTTGQIFANWTKINIDTFESNDANQHDATNKRIVITKAGRYHILGSLTVKPVGGQAYAAIYINGNRVKKAGYEISVAAQFVEGTPQPEKYFNLNVGDHIELWGYISSNATSTAVDETFLQIQQIS